MEFPFRKKTTTKEIFTNSKTNRQDQNLQCPSSYNKSFKSFKQNEFKEKFMVARNLLFPILLDMKDKFPSEIGENKFYTLTKKQYESAVEAIKLIQKIEMEMEQELEKMSNCCGDYEEIVVSETFIEHLTDLYGSLYEIVEKMKNSTENLHLKESIHQLQDIIADNTAHLEGYDEENDADKIVQYTMDEQVVQAPRLTQQHSKSSDLTARDYFNIDDIFPDYVDHKRSVRTLFERKEQTFPVSVQEVQLPFRQTMDDSVREEDYCVFSPEKNLNLSIKYVDGKLVIQQLAGNFNNEQCNEGENLRLKMDGKPSVNLDDENIERYVICVSPGTEIVMQPIDGKRNGKDDLKTFEKNIDKLLDMYDLPDFELPRMKVCSSQDIDIPSARTKLKRKGIYHPNPEVNKALKNIGPNGLLTASKPAKCGRKAVFTEKQRRGLPYAASLKSLPLVLNDVDVIKQSLLMSINNCKNFDDLKAKKNVQLSYYVNLVNDDFESSRNIPWTVPVYEVRYNFFQRKQDKSAKEKQPSSAGSSSGISFPLNVDFKEVKVSQKHREHSNILNSLKKGFLKYAEGYPLIREDSTASVCHNTALHGDTSRRSFLFASSFFPSVSDVTPQSTSKKLDKTSKGNELVQMIKPNRVTVVQTAYDMSRNEEKSACTNKTGDCDTKNNVEIDVEKIRKNVCIPPGSKLVILVRCTEDNKNIYEYHLKNKSGEVEFNNKLEPGQTNITQEDIKGLQVKVNGVPLNLDLGEISKEDIGKLMICLKSTEQDDRIEIVVQKCETDQKDKDKSKKGSSKGASATDTTGAPKTGAAACDESGPPTRMKTCSSLDLTAEQPKSKLFTKGISHTDPEIETQLKDLGPEKLIKASQPAKCSRKAVLNERNLRALPYSPSLKSLPLLKDDVSTIDESYQLSVQKRKNANDLQKQQMDKLAYYTNLVKDDLNPNPNFPWVVPVYEIRYFQIKEDKDKVVSKNNKPENKKHSVFYSIFKPFRKAFSRNTTERQRKPELRHVATQNGGVFPSLQNMVVYVAEDEKKKSDENQNENDEESASDSYASAESGGSSEAAKSTATDKETSLPGKDNPDQNTSLEYDTYSETTNEDKKSKASGSDKSGKASEPGDKDQISKSSGSSKSDNPKKGLETLNEEDEPVDNEDGSKETKAPDADKPIQEPGDEEGKDPKKNDASGPDQPQKEPGDGKDDESKKSDASGTDKPKKEPDDGKVKDSEKNDATGSDQPNKEPGDEKEKDSKKNYPSVSAEPKKEPGDEKEKDPKKNDASGKDEPKKEPGDEKENDSKKNDASGKDEPKKEPGDEKENDSKKNDASGKDKPKKEPGDEKEKDSKKNDASGKDEPKKEQGDDKDSKKSKASDPDKADKGSQAGDNGPDKPDKATEASDDPNKDKEKEPEKSDATEQTEEPKKDEAPKKDESTDSKTNDDGSNKDNEKKETSTDPDKKGNDDSNKNKEPTSEKEEPISPNKKSDKPVDENIKESPKTNKKDCDNQTESFCGKESCPHNKASSTPQNGGTTPPNCQNNLSNMCDCPESARANQGKEKYNNFPVTTRCPNKLAQMARANCGCSVTGGQDQRQNECRCALPSNLPATTRCPDKPAQTARANCCCSVSGGQDQSKNECRCALPSNLLATTRCPNKLAQLYKQSNDCLVSGAGQGNDICARCRQAEYLKQAQSQQVYKVTCSENVPFMEDAEANRKKSVGSDTNNLNEENKNSTDGKKPCGCKKRDQSPTNKEDPSTRKREKSSGDNDDIQEKTKVCKCGQKKADEEKEKPRKCCECSSGKQKTNKDNNEKEKSKKCCSCSEDKHKDNKECEKSPVEDTSSEDPTKRKRKKSDSNEATTNTKCSYDDKKLSCCPCDNETVKSANVGTNAEECSRNQPKTDSRKAEAGEKRCCSACTKCNNGKFESGNQTDTPLENKAVCARPRLCSNDGVECQLSEDMKKILKLLDDKPSKDCEKDTKKENRNKDPCKSELENRPHSSKGKCCKCCPLVQKEQQHSKRCPKGVPCPGFEKHKKKDHPADRKPSDAVIYFEVPTRDPSSSRDKSPKSTCVCGKKRGKLCPVCNKINTDFWISPAFMFPSKNCLEKSQAPGTSTPKTPHKPLPNLRTGDSLGTFVNNFLVNDTSVAVCTKQNNALKPETKHSRSLRHLSSRAAEDEKQQQSKIVSKETVENILEEYVSDPTKTVHQTVSKMVLNYFAHEIHKQIVNCCIEQVVASDKSNFCQYTCNTNQAEGSFHEAGTAIKYSKSNGKNRGQDNSDNFNSVRWSLSKNDSVSRGTEKNSIGLRDVAVSTQFNMSNSLIQSSYLMTNSKCDYKDCGNSADFVCPPKYGTQTIVSNDLLDEDTDEPVMLSKSTYTTFYLNSANQQIQCGQHLDESEKANRLPNLNTVPIINKNWWSQKNRFKMEPVLRHEDKPPDLSEFKTKSDPNADLEGTDSLKNIQDVKSDNSNLLTLQKSDPKETESFNKYLCSLPNVAPFTMVMNNNSAHITENSSVKKSESNKGSRGNSDAKSIMTSTSLMTDKVAKDASEDKSQETQMPLSLHNESISSQRTCYINKTQINEEPKDTKRIEKLYPIGRSISQVEFEQTIIDLMSSNSNTLTFNRSSNNNIFPNASAVCNNLSVLPIARYNTDRNSQFARLRSKLHRNDANKNNCLNNTRSEIYNIVNDMIIMIETIKENKKAATTETQTQCEMLETIHIGDKIWLDPSESKKLEQIPNLADSKTQWVLAKVSGNRRDGKEMEILQVSSNEPGSYTLPDESKLVLLNFR